MKDRKRSSRPRRTTERRPKRNATVHTTRTGKKITVPRTRKERIQARKDTLAKARAKRLAALPKSPVKRFFYRLHPLALYRYWFSREGGIMALKVAGIGIIAGFLLMVGLFAYFRKDLPNLRDISGSSLGGSIRYYDRTGEVMLWEDFDAVKRIPVEDERMSQYIKDATIAIEDQDFFNHSGFDVRGISRAAFNNVTGRGNSMQGGSTITQQLVRLTQAGVGNEQSYQRKIKELILSIELERSYTKQEILTGYLNAAPYGNVQYGVETASQDYFQKPAADLTLDEAAFLAAIPQAPSFYSPYGPNYDRESLVGRQHYILDQMAEQGMITTEQRDEAKEIDTTAKVNEVKQKFEGIIAPWFVMTVKDRLEEKFGDQTVQRGGWRVTTTLDLEKQKIAEEEMASGIQQVINQGGDSAAFVAQDVKNGQVVALVGGADFSNETYGQNNYARYRLPPGSSFKPYDYVALIEHSDNVGAGSVLYDTQGPLEGYPCTDRRRPRDGGNCLHNYDFRYPGPVTLRYALGGSRNVPAVKAMLTVGVDKTIEVAENLGLESGYKCYADEQFTEESQCYASAAIGDGAYLRLDEHVNAYATISRNGNKLPQSYILKIEDAAGRVVDEWQPSSGEQVVRPDSAYIVADMMADPRASYFSRKIHDFQGHKYSLKTGTTNDAKDGWLMGFSTQYSAGVWVGYHNRTRELNGFMETMTQPIWLGWMNRVHANLEPEERPRPSGVQELPAYVVRQHVGGSSIQPSPTTDLYPSWYERSSNQQNERQTIDVVSNKLATDCTPERARRESTGGSANAFSSDQFVDGGGGANLEATDDVHDCNDNMPRISILNSTCDNGRCTIRVRAVAGTHPISSDRFRGTINVIIGGRTVHTANISGAGTSTLRFAHDARGNQTVTVELIDSVLYDNRTSTRVNFGGGNSGGGSSDNDEDDG